jgi:hypothetical protein
MAGEYMQSIKVVMILCSCFFAYGVSFPRKYDRMIK